jgi:hypothetical protein
VRVATREASALDASILRAASSHVPAGDGSYCELAQLELGLDHRRRKRLAARLPAFDPLFASTQLCGPARVAVRYRLFTLAPHALQLPAIFRPTRPIARKCRVAGCLLARRVATAATAKLEPDPLAAGRPLALSRDAPVRPAAPTPAILAIALRSLCV